MVWLSSPARRILDGLPRIAPWVFPITQNRKIHLHNCHRSLLAAVRSDAGLRDVRLHDLRHTFASMAVMQGENVLTVGRLLGHNDPARPSSIRILPARRLLRRAEAVAAVLGRGAPMNRRTKLTDTLVRRLKPGNREYTVRDTLVSGLGVRVHPSGGRSYVLFCEGMKVSLGPVILKTLREARSECLASMADGFSGGRTVPMFRDFATGAWRDSWVCRCKPSRS